MPFFYFILCTTGNSSLIEVQNASKHQHKAQFEQLEAMLVNQDLLKNKIDQVQLIFGQKDPNLDNTHNYSDLHNQVLNPSADQQFQQNDILVTQCGILG